MHDKLASGAQSDDARKEGGGLLAVDGDRSVARDNAHALPSSRDEIFCPRVVVLGCEAVSLALRVEPTADIDSPDPALVPGEAGVPELQKITFVEHSKSPHVLKDQYGPAVPTEVGFP